FGKPITNRQHLLFVIEVHSWLEREVAEPHANVGQAKGRMIDHDVAAALGAIPAVAQLTGVGLTQKMPAFCDFYSLGFSQREDADRRRGITPAFVAMTVTHIERLTGRFNFHRPAITSACMCVRHEGYLYLEPRKPRTIASQQQRRLGF